MQGIATIVLLSILIIFGIIVLISSVRHRHS